MKISKHKLKFILITIIAVGVCWAYTDTMLSAANKQASNNFKPIFTDSFELPNDLLTNEYAFREDEDPDRIIDTRNKWEATSGSAYIENNVLWTGEPDSCANADEGESPNVNSTDCTNSNVFRLRTQRMFDGEMNIDFSLRQNSSIPTERGWYGTHILLRYQTQYDLYAVTVNRSDNKAVIKRKTPCGPSNSGTYYDLSPYEPYNWVLNQWQNYRITVRDQEDGSVIIQLYNTDQTPAQLIVEGTDSGGTNENWPNNCSEGLPQPDSASYQPLMTAGHIEIRGDFANFNIDNFTVSIDMPHQIFIPYSAQN